MSRQIWTTNQIRRTFLDYFCETNRHKFIPSSSVLPQKNSGLYFTNAGMNQFKPVIMGELRADEIIDPARFVGVANSQKCIRIGGKHNDLDDIGKDTYHHTFFEMLGNWSFGHYGKERACALALELLVGVYKLDINRLYFTYFGGDKALNLDADLETKGIWLRLGVPERQLLPFGMRENFWEMDTTGPCGPCTEIHYDRLSTDLSNGQQLSRARELVNAGHESVIEIWNIVFMQYNRLNKSTFSRLPGLVIDTGMGLERLTTVLNNLQSNYDTDAFEPLFKCINQYCQEHTSAKSRAYSLDQIDYKRCNLTNNPYSYAYRTLSDHVRSITVAINDGLMPSRNGLGGFLKYLILKSIKLTRETFSIREREHDLLCQLVPIVVGSLQDAYPELSGKAKFIQDVIIDTDRKQREKLANADETIERYLKKLGNPSSLTGEQLWRLFKGDGTGQEIPIEFIQEKCQERAKLDMEAFDRILLADNEKALSNMRKQLSLSDISSYLQFATKLNEANLTKTDTSSVYSLNLDKNNNAHLKAKILAVGMKSSNKFELLTSLSEEEVRKLMNEKPDLIIVLDKTNFYAEGGGQSADVGRLVSEAGDLELVVENVLHLQGYTLHVGKPAKSVGLESLRNSNVSCQVDKDARISTSLNHTAVHLLNHSIRKHFRDEAAIRQTSSSVKENAFKFEFSFTNRLSKPSIEDLNAIEGICNELIGKGLEVFTAVDVVLDDQISALKFKYPLRKLNDILYPTKLRVVSIGSKWSDFDSSSASGSVEDSSAELCCGTHASNTKQLETLSIRHFEALGDSTFLIEGCTSQKATDLKRNDEVARNYLKNLVELKGSLSEQMNPKQRIEVLSKISQNSIEIEKLFKAKSVSFLTLHQIKSESAKFRPSKTQITTALTKYIDHEMANYSAPEKFREIDATFGDLRLRMLDMSNVFGHELLAAAVMKCKSVDEKDLLVVLNQDRRYAVFYAKSGFETKPEFSSLANSLIQGTPEVLVNQANLRVLRF